MNKTLTDATLMLAIYDRRGAVVRLKTLSELDGLGRPNMGVVRALCTQLIKDGYLQQAGATKDGLVKAVKPTDKVHEGALEVSAKRNQGEEGAKEAAKRLRNELLDNGLLDRAVYQARCAWTQGDADRYLRVSEKLTTWIEVKFGHNPPRDVLRRMAQMQDRCYCWSCRADTIEKFVREDAAEKGTRKARARRQEEGPQALPADSDEDNLGGVGQVVENI